ncbi:MAG: MFS transporter [Gammaproteobacteria bacterium]|nr:MFS transporter [Gammaproteobacteria bacterium]MYK46338.1 MFS transporter [Gammaproteobacteria bacterium]
MRGGLVTPVFAAFAVQDLGLSTTEYSRFVSGLSIAAAVIGVALGPFIDRFGARRFLMGALIVGAVSHAIGGVLAERTNDLVAFGAVAVVVYLVGQVVFITVIALFMNLCWTKVAATQFAVYMALANVGIATGGLLFVPFADHLSFGQDFLVMAGLFVVSALGLVFFKEGVHAQRLEALKARAARM